jgi:hypothetical protein
MKAPRRLPPGFAIRMFVDKMRELKERLDAYSARVPARTPRAYVTHADARELGYAESGSIDLVVTSPPYPGVYDYLDHHLHRLKWLGLRESRLAESEIGARREYRRLGLDRATELWRREIGLCLKEMRRVLASDGRGVIIIADSVVDRQALWADEEIRKAAEEYGVDVMAIASQPRPLFLHGADQVFADSPRREHVVIIRPGKAKKAFRAAFSRDEDSDAPAGRARPERATAEGPRPYGRSAGPPRRDAPRADSPARERPWQDGPRRDAPVQPSARQDQPRTERPLRDGSRRVESGAGVRREPSERAGRAYGPGRSERRTEASPDDSQRKTWGTKPRGPGKPRSRS